MDYRTPALDHGPKDNPNPHAESLLKKRKCCQIAKKKRKKKKKLHRPNPLAKPFSVIIHLSASLIVLCPYHPLDPSPPPFYFPLVLFCSLSILPLNWTLSVTAVVWIQLVLPHLTNRLCCLFALIRIYGSKWKENWRSASLSFSNYFTKPYLFPLLEWKCIGKENHFWTWWFSSLSIAV